MNTRSHDVLRELGWRLQHHCAARSVDADTLAERVGLAPDDLALAFVGGIDLPFSVVSAILDCLDLAWQQLYSTDLLSPRIIYNLPIESDAWQAIASGVQSFEIRRDVERYSVGDWLRLHEKMDAHRTERVLTMEVTYLLYLASVNLPPGYVAMALRQVDISRLSAAAPPLTEAQQAELRTRLDAYAKAPHDNRTWDDIEACISRRPLKSTEK